MTAPPTVATTFPFYFKAKTLKYKDKETYARPQNKLERKILLSASKKTRWKRINFGI